VKLDLGPRAEAFRTELRAWLAEHAPADGLPLAEEGSALPPHDPRVQAWTDELRQARLLCVTWPEEYGGRGLSGAELAVMNEEFAAAGVPRITRGMGESLVGPAIIVHGTEEQKRRFLPRIISGEDVYCQGFSEPDAGSDLASLQTRGVVDGDELVLTGQKVWTSWYHDATMLFALCRTDPAASKHGGISYALVPVRRPDGSPNGVEFRPITQISGSRHFAETFLDGARAPLDHVIGGLNEGWRTAMTTLGNERGGTATTHHVRFQREFWSLVDEVRARGQARDRLRRQQLAWAYTHVEIMRYQGLRLLSAILTDREPGPGGSLSKVFWSEYERRFAEIALEVLGADATVYTRDRGRSGSDDLGHGDEGGGQNGRHPYRPDRWPALFFATRSHTIWGGTAEIQRNIIGERVLGLAREPKPPSAG
jgi:hypothetical protein